MKTERNVIPFPQIRRRRIVHRVRQLTENTCNIEWTRHALERQDEQGITARQVLSTVRRGCLVGEPVPDDGAWKITMTRRCAGRRIRVVVSVTERDELFIVAVM